MMNSSLVTQEEQEQEQEQEQQHLHLTPPPSNRIRSHSLKPRYSKQDYVRRKSAADVASTTPIRLKLSTENNELEHTNTPPPRRASATWFQRRFTLFSFEPEDFETNQQRRMTTGRFSIFDNQKNLLKRKRPSVISQMVEVFDFIRE
jgi:hypothetical protein